MTTPRRALPTEGDADHGRRPVEGARRGVEPSYGEVVGRRPSQGARRAAGPPDDAGADDRRAWQVLGALGIALVLVVGVLYAMVGSRPSTAEPASSSPAPAVSVSPSTTEASTSPEFPTSQPSTAGAGTPAASSSPDPSGDEIDLMDTTLTVPEGWEVYADELVQDSRRLVRLREPETDVRVQAVSLTSMSGDLGTACGALVADQSTAFSGVATSDVVEVPVVLGASGVSCAFTGTRVSDGVPVKTEFTLLRRELDEHTLVFRDTVPTAVPDDSSVLTDLTSMECDAAEWFGVAVQSC